MTSDCAEPVPRPPTSRHVSPPLRVVHSRRNPSRTKPRRAVTKSRSSIASVTVRRPARRVGVRRRRQVAPSFPESAARVEPNATIAPPAWSRSAIPPRSARLETCSNRPLATWRLTPGPASRGDVVRQREDRAGDAGTGILGDPALPGVRRPPQAAALVEDVAVVGRPERHVTQVRGRRRAELAPRRAAVGRPGEVAAGAEREGDVAVRAGPQAERGTSRRCRRRPASRCGRSRRRPRSRRPPRRRRRGWGRRTRRRTRPGSC
jgi:hypothetical protein